MIDWKRGAWRLWVTMSIGWAAAAGYEVFKQGVPDLFDIELVSFVNDAMMICGFEEVGSRDIEGLDVYVRGQTTTLAMSARRQRNSARSRQHLMNVAG